MPPHRERGARTGRTGRAGLAGGEGHGGTPGKPHRQLLPPPPRRSPASRAPYRDKPTRHTLRGSVSPRLSAFPLAALEKPKGFVRPRAFLLLPPLPPPPPRGGSRALSRDSSVSLPGQRPGGSRCGPGGRGTAQAATALLGLVVPGPAPAAGPGRGGAGRGSGGAGAAPGASLRRQPWLRPAPACACGARCRDMAGPRDLLAAAGSSRSGTGPGVASGRRAHACHLISGGGASAQRPRTARP